MRSFGPPESRRIAINDNPHTRHLTSEEIARIIEGREALTDESRLWKHLQGCPHCFQVYQDSAVNRSFCLFDDKEFQADDELVALGRQIGEGRAFSSRQKRRTGWLSRKLPRYGFAAAVAALCVFAAVWTGVIRRGESFHLAAELIAPIEAGVIEFSSSTPDVLLPGGEDAPYMSDPPTRSGTGVKDSSLKSAIASLMQMYRYGEENAEVRYWLTAGLIANYELKAASNLVHQICGHYPDDLRFEHLCAVIAILDNDLQKAEDKLQRILESDDKNDTARINLAVVLLEKGESFDANLLLEQVRRNNPESPLAERAESLQFRLK